jgi:hypothetical protein
MNYFTYKYNELTKLDCLPFPVAIKHDDQERWICGSYKEIIGRLGFQITLVDNYMELYTFIWSGPGTTELYSKSGSNIIINYPNNNMTNLPESIICRGTKHDLLALPDFAIDVLHTVQTNTLYEVIRRINVAFHAKNKSLQSIIPSTCPYLYNPLNPSL